jgi:hypothetical protein
MFGEERSINYQKKTKKKVPNNIISLTPSRYLGNTWSIFQRKKKRERRRTKTKRWTHPNRTLSNSNFVKM